MSQKVADIDYNQLFSANFGYTLHLLTHAQVLPRRHVRPRQLQKGAGWIGTSKGEKSRGGEDFWKGKRSGGEDYKGRMGRVPPREKHPATRIGGVFRTTWAPGPSLGTWGPKPGPPYRRKRPSSTLHTVSSSS